MDGGMERERRARRTPSRGRHLACGLLLAALTWLPPAGHAQQVRLDDHGITAIEPPAHGEPGHELRLPDPDAPLGRYVRLLAEERGHPLTLEQARRALAEGRFSRSASAVPNLGNDAPPGWLVLDIDDAQYLPRTWRIYVVEGWADRVDAWLVGPGGRITPWQGGDERAPGRDLHPGLGFAFDARLQPGRSQLFVRADSVDSVQFGVRLVPMDRTGLLEGSTRGWLGLVHGYLLALVATFGLLWLALRESSLRRYVFYVGSYLFMHLAYSGVAARVVWPDAPLVGRYAILVGMTLFSSTGLAFARDFLRMARWAPRLDRALAWLVRLGLAGMALCIVTNAHALAVTLAFAYINVFTVLMVVIGVLAVRRRAEQAWPFFVASLISMVGAFITTQAVMGRLPFNDMTFRLIEVGIMTEASIWALALGLRLRRDREDRAQALQLAEHDALTGLYNRRGFLVHAAPLFDAAATPGAHALAMLDIDHFKAINDRHGHDAGDRTLVAVADTLRAATRSRDLLARWGGEEFVVLLPDTPMHEALAIAERLRAALAGLAVPLAGASPIRITASLGVAHGEPAADLDDLLRLADDALYASKQDGRNRVSPMSLPAGA